MAKGRYAVVGSKTRKVKKRYAVIGGVTRKIKKRYVVVDGKTRLCWSGSGLFSAPTYTEAIVLTSEDGATWKENSNSSWAYLNPAYACRFASGNGMFVAITHQGKVKYSENGVNWTAGTTFSEGASYDHQVSLTFCNNKFIAIIISSVYTSTDGKTWTKVGTINAGWYTSATSVMLSDIVYGKYNNSYCYMVATTNPNGSSTGYGQCLLKSTDLLNWTLVYDYGNYYADRVRQHLCSIGDTVYWSLIYNGNLTVSEISKTSATITQIATNWVNNLVDIAGVCNPSTKQIAYTWSIYGTVYNGYVDLGTKAFNTLSACPSWYCGEMIFRQVTTTTNGTSATLYYAYNGSFADRVYTQFSTRRAIGVCYKE